MWDDEIYSGSPSSGGLGKIFKGVVGALGSVNPLIGAGLISGIGSLGASLFGSSMGVKQSKELMDYQYQLQQKAIDAQNLYNSPVEQVKRLAAAQLNPNLVYGHGVDGNQSSAASPSAVNRNVDLANPLQDLAVNMRNQAMLDLSQQHQENENRQTDANIANTNARTLGTLLDNTFKDRSLESRLKQEMQKVLNMVADENKTYSDISLNASKANQIEIQNLLTKEQITLTQLKQATERARPDAIRAQAFLAWKRGELTQKQINYFDSLTNAQISLLMKQADYYIDASNNQDVQSRLNSSRKTAIDQENKFMKRVYEDGGIKPIDLLRLAVGAIGK